MGERYSRLRLNLSAKNRAPTKRNAMTMTVAMLVEMFPEAVSVS